MMKEEMKSAVLNENLIHEKKKKNSWKLAKK